MDTAERQEKARNDWKQRIWWARAAVTITRAWGIVAAALCLIVAWSRSEWLGTVLWILIAGGAVAAWIKYDRPRQQMTTSRGVDRVQVAWPERACGVGLGRWVNGAEALRTGALSRVTAFDVLTRQRSFSQAREYANACFACDVGDTRNRYPYVPQVLNATEDTHGVQITVRLLYGQTWQGVANKAGELATAAGAPTVRVTAGEPGTAVIRFVATDVLATARRSTDSEAATVAPIIVGRDELGAEVRFDLRAPWHVAAQGQARSGKSTALYTLLGGLAQMDSVLVGGVDPSGLLLGAFEGVTDPRLLALGTSDLDAYLSVVDRYVEEMDRRISEELRSSGQDALSEFSPSLPLLVVVLEEYAGALRQLDAADAELKPAERRGKKFRSRVERLVAEGPKAGIRVVLLAQRMDAAIIGGSNRSNFGLRFSLRVDPEGFRMLHPTNEQGLDSFGFAPGYAVVSEPGEEDRLIRFDLTEYPEYVERVRGRHNGSGAPHTVTA